MKNLKQSIFIVILTIIVLIFAFSTCSGNGIRVKNVNSIEAAEKYLSTANGGANVDDPIPLKVKINLQNMTSKASGWQQLIGIIDTAGKYVKLDLSGCKMPNTEFNPADNVKTGKKYIVSLVLPEVAESISEALRDATFMYFTNLEEITGNKITSIGENAFNCFEIESCRQLINVSFPLLSSIGESAFYASRVESITIGNGITSFGELGYYWGEQRLLAAYNASGKTAGTYVKNEDRIWIKQQDKKHITDNSNITPVSNNESIILWENLEYGMSIEQVKKSFPSMWEENPELWHFDHYIVHNMNFYLTFFFENEKLASIGMSLINTDKNNNSNESLSPDDGDNVYYILVKTLKSQYGEPIESNRENYDNGYALKSIWTSGKTKIELLNYIYYSGALILVSYDIL